MRFPSRFRLLVALAFAALLLLAISAEALAPHRSRHLFRGTRSVLSAAQVRRLSAHATERSIIIFRNQLSNLPARGRAAGARAVAARAVQSGVLSELAQLHVKRVQSFQIVDAVAATISPAEAARLRANPSVQAVVPDGFTHLTPVISSGGAGLPAGIGARIARARGAAGDPQLICPANPAQPLVEPEARTVMNVDAADRIVNGAGVKVGIIADGIDPNNPDLIRSGGQHVIFDYEDFSGYGPTAPTDGREAFLDAGTIASQGNQTYDLSTFVNPAHPLPPGCNIKIEGIAPGASLAVLNVAGSAPGFFNSQIIQAVQWAVMHDHVNVLNESIGGSPIPNTEDDPVALADQAAVAAGVTVVASSGDAGPFNNIGSPATTPGVIAAGGTTTYQVYRQTTRYGTNLVPGGWEDNNITALSSSGFTEFNPSTVDVVAPGDRGWSLCSTNITEFVGCRDIDNGSAPGIWAAGGTSASAPETSGTAALVIEAYANTHGGTTPSPALVKQIIMSSATDLGAPADHQGAGLVNTLKAVQLAESIHTSSPQGSSLLVSQPSLSATVDAGQSHTFNVGVTNEGAAAQTVTPTVSGRPTTISSDTGSVTLSSASPTYIDGEGHTDFYALHTFTVPAGADYLNGDITWNDQAVGGVAYETLFDPTGSVAAYSLIGANQSGFGHVEVRKPMAGTWTAVIFTVSTAPYFGSPVQFSYSTEQFHSVGSVTPSSRTLSPGQSGTFHVTVTAGQAGDESLALHLGTGGSDDGSIPIVLRARVPLGSSGGSFAGALTGGGASFNAGQEFTYQFEVRGGQPALNVAVQLADSDYGLEGFLVDPNGEPLDAQTTANDTLAPGSTMQFFRGHPQAGLWTLILLAALPVDGAHLSEPFTGSVDFAAPQITSSGIPDSRHTALPAGQPVTATVTVTNTGNIQKDFFVDPRLRRRAQLPLVGGDVNNVPLPLSLTAQPVWLVPPGTNSLTIGAQGTAPITMDVTWAFGDPDFLGDSFGNFSVANLSAPEVAPGFWFATPDATGPFTSATTAKVNLAGFANTNEFDSAVSSTTGDVWEQSVDPSAFYSPLTLDPGQTGTITLTFAPNAPKGRVVRGFIGVDTANLGTASGDEIQKIPYEYKVG